MAAAFARSGIGFGVLFAVVVLSYVAARRLGVLARLVPAVLGLALFAFAVNALATPGEPWRAFGPLVLTREGIALGREMAARLGLTGLAFGWVAATARAGPALDELRGGLLRHFGRAGDAIGLVLVVALRFGPLMLEEGRRLLRTVGQRAGRKPGLWAAPAIAVPLVLLAVRRADRMAYVLEARHFGAAKRTPPVPHRLSGRDVALAGLGVAIAVGTVALGL